jgi:dihydroorotate dehydrogenase
LHWARKVVFVSAFVGFASFFLFLGFGYLDPFHAFVTTVLFQFLLMGMHSRLEANVSRKRINLNSDRVWRLSLWGQLLMVIHGFALLIAGAVISFIGVTQVFVPEDLQFMHSTVDSLHSINSRLVPLIAHDRATFGGMLLSSGFAFLLTSLWGYRRSSQWLWWMLLLAGLPAYIAAIGVHFAVEYLSWKHLLPAFGGLAMFLTGMSLSFPFLCDDSTKA